MGQKRGAVGLMVVEGEVEVGAREDDAALDHRREALLGHRLGARASAIVVVDHLQVTDAVAFQLFQ